MTETQKRIYDLTHEPRNGWDIAGDIAAEITALQERNAFLLTGAETAQAKLAEARAEVDRLTHGLALSNAIAAGKPIQYVGPLEGMKESLEASYRSALNESARQIGQMKQWLSEASAQNQKTSRELAESRTEVESRDTYIAELAQKLDRMAPYAEAALHTLRAERMFSPSWLIDHREESNKIAAADFEIWRALRQRYMTEYPADSEKVE